ncbi:unnamed protein product [Orchesella dallaii]|uniref:Uncharacterized protein n=1 Tax=Orchesella dallaii TaxID=48710 RepID=A0ABP1QMH9_9HEXA
MYPIQTSLHLHETSNSNNSIYFSHHQNDVNLILLLNILTRHGRNAYKPDIKSILLHCMPIYTCSIYAICITNSMALLACNLTFLPTSKFIPPGYILKVAWW